jgi:hypothetical protein
VRATVRGRPEVEVVGAGAFRRPDCAPEGHAAAAGSETRRMRARVMRKFLKKAARAPFVRARVCRRVRRRRCAAARHLSRVLRWSGESRPIP